MSAIKIFTAACLFGLILLLGFGLRAQPLADPVAPPAIASPDPRPLPSPTPTPAPAPPPAESLSLERRLIQKNIQWSQTLDQWADGIDLFLMGKRITKRKNETSVRLENSSYFMESENFRNTWNIHADLKLPNLEDYWRLKFTSYDQNEDRRGVQRDYLRRTPRQQNYGATLGLLRSFGPVKTSFAPRIELSSPLRVSHSLSFESVGELENYQINPKIEFFANPDKGTGVFLALNFNVRLTDAYSLSFLNDGEYEENLNLFTVNNGLSLGHFLNERMGISYNVVFTSNNRPHYHLESYSLSVAWSHTIYNRILDYEIIPHLDFYRTSSFKGRAGLIVNLNLTF